MAALQEYGFVREVMTRSGGVGYRSLSPASKEALKRLWESAGDLSSSSVLRWLLFPKKRDAAYVHPEWFNEHLARFDEYLDRAEGTSVEAPVDDMVVASGDDAVTGSPETIEFDDDSVQAFALFINQYLSPLFVRIHHLDESVSVVRSSQKRLEEQFVRIQEKVGMTTERVASMHKTIPEVLSRLEGLGNVMSSLRPVLDENLNGIATIVEFATRVMDRSLSKAELVAQIEGLRGRIDGVGAVTRQMEAGVEAMLDAAGKLEG